MKKYRPHFYVNGHDHVMCYFNAAMYGYSTQFFTSGASLVAAEPIGVSAAANTSWQGAASPWPDPSPTALIKIMACPAGAGSFTEPNDGGWNKTSGNVGSLKRWLLLPVATCVCQGITAAWHEAHC